MPQTWPRVGRTTVCACYRSGCACKLNERPLSGPAVLLANDVHGAQTGRPNLAISPTGSFGAWKCGSGRSSPLFYRRQARLRPTWHFTEINPAAQYTKMDAIPYRTRAGAVFHSITLSARAIIESGRLISKDCAVFILTASSK